MPAAAKPMLSARPMDATPSSLVGFWARAMCSADRGRARWREHAPIPLPTLGARTRRLAVDPSPRIDRRPFFGHLGRLLTACDHFDVGFLFGKDPPYADLSVPQSVGELGVYFDPIASVVGLDNHRGIS